MQITKQLSRFSIVGIFSTLLNYFFYILLFKLKFNILFCSAFGYTIGFINSYYFGKKWVFRNFSTINFLSIGKFLSIYFFSGLVMSLIIYSLTNNGFEYRLAWITGLLFSVINNFLGCKFFVFKK